MTFEELWEDVWKYSFLPAIAKEQLPNSLSEKTKRKMLEWRLPAEELGKVIEEAVDQINHGSVESLDTLIRAALK